MQSNQKNRAGEKVKKAEALDIKELFGRIKQCVAAGDINTAESLHDALMQSETNALAEIVASAELIEQAKLAEIDKEHMLIWNELYETLSPEEKVSFFYSLTEKTLPPKSILTRQGNLNDCLFFLEKGRLAAIFTKEKVNNLVLQVGKGGFVGENTFFGMTVCTSSVVAQSDVVVKILKKERVQEWEEKSPGLYAKLQSYCRLNDQYAEAYERKRQEKSRFQRVSVSGQVCADLLSSNMKPTGRHFKASLGDVSRGGACFFIKSSRKDLVESLLAESLQMIFTIEGKDDPVEFMARGRVVKIQFLHMGNEYSVHVSFSSPLGKDKLELLQASQ